MKKTIKTFLALLILFSISNTSKAQIPTYTLIAKNFTFPSPNIMDFEIYLKHTNPSTSTFEYAGGQYNFGFNLNFGNGGTLTYSIAPANSGDSSDMPVNMRPRTPSIASALGVWLLRTATNVFPPAGSGYIISSTGQGTKIIRLRLQTSASSFSHSINDTLNLRWRSLVGLEFPPVTKLFAFVNGTNTEIDDPANYFIYFTDVNLTLAIEGLYNIPTNNLNRRDTVRANLRSVTSPYNIIDFSISLIDTLTFTGAFIFGNSPTGIYYIEIKYRNGIETWSKAGGETITNRDLNNYDFTASATQAFGNNLKLKGTKYCIYSGDVNQDGTVDGLDLSRLDNDVVNYATGYIPSDMNGTNFVDGTDMLIVDNNAADFISKIIP